MNYNLNYVFRLVDNFSGGAIALSAAMGRVTAATNKMTAAGLAVAAAGGIMATAFGSAVAAATSWEDRMANVRRTADLSRKEMLDYGRDALDLSVKLGTPVEAVADTMSRLAQTGLRDRRMLKEFTELTAKAAVAWDDISAEEAGKSIGKFATIWFKNQGPDQAIESIRNFGDVINELSNRSNFKAPQLLKYLDRVSPMMESIGLTAAQAAAFGGTVLATGVESGQMQGTRAEMTMRKLLEAATRPTKNQKWALNKLGLDPGQLAAMVRSSPQDAILALLEGVQKYDTVGRTAVANSLLGTRQGAQFVALAQNLNEYKRQLAIADDTYAKRFSQDEDFMKWLRQTGKYDDMVEMLEKYGKIVSRVNSLEREFAKRSDTLKFAVAQRDAAFRKLQIALGEPLLEPLANLNKGLAGFLDQLGDSVLNNGAAGKFAAYGLGAAVAGSIAAGLWAGLTAKGGILAKLLVGGTVGALALTVGVALVGAGAWILLNWDDFVAKVTQPLNLNLQWPEAPAWVQWLLQKANQASALRDQENRNQERFRRYGFQDWDYAPVMPMPTTVEAEARRRAEAARLAVRGNPFAQFPMPPTIPYPGIPRSGEGLFDPHVPNLGPWGPNGPSVNGAQLAASIPQSVAVSVTSDVRLTAANMTVTYNGPISGPSNVPVGGEASRGTSTATVGGGPASLGGMGIP